MSSTVELLEVFGNDLTVVNAARVSFAKESNVLDSKDEKLIAYLAKHKHTSPFFHPQVRFRIKMPIFIAREWFRHTVGGNVNEVSRRYVDSDIEFFMPDGLRARDKNLKQGSKEEFIENNNELMLKMEEWNKSALDFYNLLIKENVAPEVARMILPLSLQTSFIQTGSLAFFARICQLRLDPHAQKEIQDIAKMVAVEMEKAFPVSWKALMQAN
jgi:thymidylate synthase (FAD)